jgi:anti-sigma regulatory factor (Ser/Thr protein kinase)
MRSKDADKTTLSVVRLEDAAVVRAIVRRRALGTGLSERVAGEVALGASELATNLVKHAGGGEIELTVEGDTLIVCSLDRGPGPPPKESLLRDNWSRGGERPPDAPIREGLGSGGAALGRLFDRVDVEAREGGGALIRCVRKRSK